MWILVSLRNHDGDGNEYSKKEIDLDKQNNNFARASPFFVHLVTFLCRRCTTTTWICPIWGSANSLFKVFEHSFGSLWVYVICQIMTKERLQLTSWKLASEKYTDESFWSTGKMWRFRCFHGNMNDWIQLLLSLHKIRSLDFPINLRTAYYN